MTSKFRDCFSDSSKAAKNVEARAIANSTIFSSVLVQNLRCHIPDYTYDWAEPNSPQIARIYSVFFVLLLEGCFQPERNSCRIDQWDFKNRNLPTSRLGSESRAESRVGKISVQSRTRTRIENGAAITTKTDSVTGRCNRRRNALYVHERSQLNRDGRTTTRERVAELRRVMAAQTPPVHAYIVPTADAHSVRFIV
ncbi:hypothetical protein EVAR_42485_1 [Eumeta japonica]|uniref:Uncharacterized protein n=1 Tax=Eumeta variegata TaxID=151549 RepID=A0A4C1XZZ0_EUMVA|nr:hypothetical protein EVAR_42485_1 [Eumeta japonica]